MFHFLHAPAVLLANGQRAVRIPVIFASLLLAALSASAQSAPEPAPLPPARIVDRVSPAVAVVLAGKQGGGTSLGSAVVVRQDGVLLTAYHAVKGARQAQVRFKNGEIYDKVELLAFDERRDVAALRVSATNLPVLPTAGMEETRPGDTVYVVSNAGALPWTASSGVVSALRVADEVPGAGSGYRLIQFTAPVSPGSSGGVLVDVQARLLGIIVGSRTGQNLNFAVPIESVVGLANRSGGTLLASGADLQLPGRPAPDAGGPSGIAPPPPAELSDRERSEALASRDPMKILRSFRTIYVESHTIWMESQMLEHALRERPEFGVWGLEVVKDPSLADLKIEVHVPVFTFDYHYTVTHQNSSIVLVAGKVRAASGLDAAPKIAKNFMEETERSQRPLPSGKEKPPPKAD